MGAERFYPIPNTHISGLQHLRDTITLSVQQTFRPWPDALVWMTAIVLCHLVVTAAITFVVRVLLTIVAYVTMPA